MKDAVDDFPLGTRELFHYYVCFVVCLNLALTKPKSENGQQK